MIWIAIWLILGLCGYFMLRQGFLVAFESCLGKEEAWDKDTKRLSMVAIITRPIAMMYAVVICGGDCFHKRIKAE